MDGPRKKIDGSRDKSKKEERYVEPGRVKRGYGEAFYTENIRTDDLYKKADGASHTKEENLKKGEKDE
ncbi:MAG: hypothetical protein KJ906_01080 [Nanoarchaeota archaeon]|nr:hypothetical protein [Nanoarchaeota archaeon]